MALEMSEQAVTVAPVNDPKQWFVLKQICDSYVKNSFISNVLHSRKLRNLKFNESG